MYVRRTATASAVSLRSRIAVASRASSLILPLQPQVVMAYVIMTYVVMTCVVMAYVVMTHVAMAYVIMT